MGCVQKEQRLEINLCLTGIMHAFPQEYIKSVQKYRQQPIYMVQYTV